MLEATPVVVIEGARQVGKSTFAGMLLDGRPHVSLTLDDEGTRTLLREDPVGLLGQYAGQTVLIDEAQREPDALIDVKAAVDKDRRPGRFVLTGSSDLLRLPRSPESLAGRSMVVSLRGLSQGELRGQREDFASWLLAQQDTKPERFGTTWTRQEYVTEITLGGYPELRALAPDLRRDWVRAYIAALLRRDARDIRKRIDPVRLRAVLRLLAAAPAGELVKGRIAQAAGLSASTVNGYFDTLATMFLTIDVPPWTRNLTRRETGRHKVSVADTGVNAYVAGLAAAKLATVGAGQDLGPLTEAFVTSELLKQSGWTANPFDMYHWRDADGLEVDLVLELEDGRAILLEVKTAQAYRPAQATSLRRVAAALGDRFAAGAVLGMGSHGLRIGDRMYYLPIAALWDHADRPQ
ncbi:MAG: ATP-binding protein [Bifidobacteriaceae bacterium]|nr:ATP-binding protein [Bifidobacteriaceae bacterium]